MSNRLPIVVLISGSGSNLQAIINAINHKALNVSIRAVISNKANAYGLERAKQADIPSIAIEHTDFATRERFEAKLSTTIEQYSPRFVVLAGFMRRLTAEFVQTLSEKMINIHPSLLPKYPGLNTYRKALSNKEAFHGVTVHYVTADVDAGPIISQARFPISASDDETSLRQQTQALEHKLYPKVLSWLAADRLTLEQGVVKLDGQPTPIFDHNMNIIAPIRAG